MSIDRFQFANALRGPAAIAVLVSHFMHNAWMIRPLLLRLANVSMPSESAVATPRYVEALAAVPGFDWGGYGVAIFFLISGFVIPLSLKKYSTSAFLVGRFFRIWPVYAAGFTICILSIYLGGHVFSRPFPYTFYEVAIHYFPGLRDLASVPGIDGIVWTLEIEIKFYVLCAVLAPMFRRSNNLVFIVPVVIGAICMLAHGYFDHHDASTRASKLVASYLLGGQFIVFMFLGTLFAFWTEGAIKARLALPTAAVFFAIFLCLLRWGALRSIDIHPLGYVAAIATFLLYARFKRRTSRIEAFFSNISYPLYASHGVFGYVIIAVVLRVGGSPEVAIVAAFGITIAVATLLHLFIERPTHKIGQALARSITSRRTRAGHTLGAA